MAVRLLAYVGLLYQDLIRTVRMVSKRGWANGVMPVFVGFD